MLFSRNIRKKHIYRAIKFFQAQWRRLKKTMKPILSIIAGVIVVLTGISLAFTVVQVREERAVLSADLEYRTRLLSDSLKASLEPAYSGGSVVAVQKIIDRFSDRERLGGLSIVNAQGEEIATLKDMPQFSGSGRLAAQVMDANASRGEFMRSGGESFYVFVSPLRESEGVVGALLIVQNAQYIDEYIAGIWWDNAVRLVTQIVFFSLVLAVIIRWVIIKPLARLAESVKSARAGAPGATIAEHSFFFQPLALEVAKILKSLSQARSAASEEARLRLEKLDTPWTAERLKEFVKAYLKNRPIVLVSNREPYVHEKKDGKITYSVPASGMVTALEAVMAACGGTWIAHGSGNADKEVADAEGKVRVPPEEPQYTLKRVWLTEKDVQGFYVGYSNEALWPLSHMAHVRPTFRKEDWMAYRRVNGKFAEQLLAEIKDLQNPIVLVQDYHFALLPRMIKKARPDAAVGFFWHIPWPSAERFSICPQRKEIIEGILGADLVGFHTQQHCNNFLDTVGKEIEALIDLEHFSVSADGHTTRIAAFPISIAFTNGDARKENVSRDAYKALGIETEYVGLGVDRLDYTKGILERFRAVEFFLDAHPEYHEKFTFLQISSPSREASEKYRMYAKECADEAERINKKFESKEWRPIRFEKRHYSHEELAPLYAGADFCLVTSLHDGMNLVAKEYVAARNTEDGVLILSQFTGASRGLKGAIIVNPYSAEETSNAIHTALTMSPAEQHRRMKVMRNAVKDSNVYRWSAEFLKVLASVG